VTPDQLRGATSCTAQRAAECAAPLSAACAFYGIDTPARLAAFLAEIGHESGSLRYLREIWGPTAAQQGYEGRRDLGNTEPGDGRRYLGRGFIQNTGRANYRRLTQRLRERFAGAPDFEANPEALEDIEWAAIAAADYWDMRGLNAMADAGQFDRISKAINLGNPDSRREPNGAADRRRRLAQAQQALLVFGAPKPQPIFGRVDGYEPPVIDLARLSYHVTDAALPPVDPQQPAGGAPAKQQEASMPLPFLAAVLPSIISAVPKLIETFGSGSEVSQRNQKAAEMVVGVAKEALGAVNEQQVAERLASDPAAPAIVRKAIEDRWFQISEAGGGGIDGARTFLKDAGSNPAMAGPVWRIVAVVTYAALAFLVLANVMAGGAWVVSLVHEAKGLETATQFVSQVIQADIGAALMAFGFWLGSSWGSKQQQSAKEGA
jgi:putative chitinase